MARKPRRWQKAATPSPLQGPCITACPPPLRLAAGAATPTALSFRFFLRASFSPSGTKLVSVGHDDVIKVFDNVLDAAKKGSGKMTPRCVCVQMTGRAPAAAAAAAATAAAAAAAAAAATAAAYLSSFPPPLLFSLLAV